jgi:hypothetical protein
MLTTHPISAEVENEELYLLSLHATEALVGRQF